MKLFISHSSNDINIVKPFVELLFQMGLTEQNIFCSSISNLGIPITEDIYEYLSKMIDNEEIYALFLLSDNYYESAACLNEMGAIWVKKTDYLTFLLPGFDYQEIKGAINPRKISIKLGANRDDLSGQLDKFMDNIVKKFKLPLSITRWEKIRNNFLTQIEYNPQISLLNCKTYCIGENTNVGCQIIQNDNNEKKVSTKIDFSKTKSDLCSIVIKPNESNWFDWVIDNRNLCFEARATGGLHEFYLELQVPSAGENFKIPQQIYEKETEYRIPLKNICKEALKWKRVNEINFLIEKQEVQNEYILSVCNLRIE